MEQRCGHGFLRSMVACYTCDPGKTTRQRLEHHTERKVYVEQMLTRRRGEAEPVKLTGTYVCKACDTEKPKTEFYISRTSRLGHQSRCKACDNNKAKRTRAASRQEAAA